MRPTSALTRVLASSLALTLGACASAPRSTTGADTGQRPRSIILLMADGAGTAHWTLAAYAADDLAVRRMQTVGLVDTRGADHTVSGSAPTATAYAIGVRSRMGYVGVGPDGRPRTSVLEVAMARGKSAGLVTTTSIVDATPAAFGGHNTSRGASGALAREMSSKGIAVLMGGGRAAFRPDAQPDGRDLLEQAREDYTYVASVTELRDLDPDTVDALLGLFAEEGMGPVAERGAALSSMTRTALAILARDPDGFFLMIENEESDSQSHRNAGEPVVTAEMLDFDRAVRIALDYRVEHPETLVVVTSDHETGGIALVGDEEREIVMRYATTGHTAAMIPLFAAGPGAERFAGILRNDQVGQILLELVR